MTIELHTEGPVPIIEIAGRLSTVECPLLEEPLFALISERPTVLLDCEKLEYVSSHGLRLFLRAAKVARNANGQLAVCSVSPTIQELFEISGFSAILTIYPDRALALQSL